MKEKQKILLIRCNYLPGPIGRLLAPPIGILTLAAVVRQERPQRTEIRAMDTGTGRLSPKDVGEIIKSWEPDIVGISAFSLESGNLHAIAATAKQINPQITVVAGGAHASTFYDLLLMDGNVDYAVIGEGEETFVELLDHLYEGSEPKNVPGLACSHNGELLYGGDRPFIEDLDSIPMPAWDLINLKPYTGFTSMNGIIAGMPYANLFTSRACPYGCVYCHKIFGKKFRAQSPERVLDEIELLSRRFGVKEIQFHDDVFNLKRERVLAIAEGVVDRGIKMKFSFPNAVRGDLMTRDVVKALARAGTYSIVYAVETASPRLQKLIHKNLDLDKVREAVEWTYDEGMIPAGFFMLGFPTETREEMEQTLEFALNSKMLKALFFCVVPFPRTGMYDLVKKTYPNFDVQYDSSSYMHYWSKKPYYSDISGIDISRLQKRAFLKFYLAPWRFTNILKRYPKNLSFLINSWHGITSSLLGISRPDEPQRDLLSGVPAGHLPVPDDK